MVDHILESVEGSVERGNLQRRILLGTLAVDIEQLIKGCGFETLILLTNRVGEVPRHLCRESDVGVDLSGHHVPKKIFCIPTFTQRWRIGPDSFECADEV